VEHGNQKDGISCGICTLNMIAFQVLKEPLWSASQAVYEHAQWFNRIVMAHNSLVSKQLAVNKESGRNVLQKTMPSAQLTGQAQNMAETPPPRPN
jgi:hypothetical protein